MYQARHVGISIAEIRVMKVTKNGLKPHVAGMSCHRAAIPYRFQANGSDSFKYHAIDTSVRTDAT